MGCLMVYYSRIVKLREREPQPDLLPLTGREQVLDVGCGRGLMAVAAARRLPGGKVVSINTWRAED